MLYLAPGLEALSIVRIAILADIHSNLEALSAVVANAGEQGDVDEIWCLGDTVGYGPDPAACLDTALSMKHVLVAGNHDLAAVGRISLADFNPYAAEACLWTRDRLSPEHRDRLAELPLQAEQAPFTLVHGSPRDPVWEYVVSQDVALACFDHFTTTHCLVGHSHVPFVCRLNEQGLEFARVHSGSCVPLGRDRLIINPGGVGQPRDGDPRASYAIYHVEESIVEFRRVDYDVEATQRKMRAAGLPEYLAERLSYGR